MTLPTPIQPAVEMRGITKRFGALVANDRVDFAVQTGEVHALLGENGAGKSTLTKILYGLYQPDAGSLLVKGQPRQFRSPADAIAQGIGMVTQHFSLVPTLTVAENLMLSQAKGITLNLRAAETAIQATAKRYGFQVDPQALVQRLSIGEQQRVEILKALYQNCRVLILDEPTAVLTPQEAEGLFVALRGLVAQGSAVVFISHKLNEVLAISNRVTVLRAGKVVGEVKTAEATRLSLARLMVGREVTPVQSNDALGLEKSTQRPVLQLETSTPAQYAALTGATRVDLVVQAGEIVGLAGVAGNGQTELGEVLSGLRTPTQGRVLVDKTDVTRADPTAMTRAGVGRIPEDRLKGVVATLTVAENMALEALDELAKRDGQLDRPRLRTHAQQLIDAFQIKALVSTRAGSLSGGNMQKVILARVLSRNPKVIVAAQPTLLGLDVGAIQYVHEQLLAQRTRGAGILLISEDLDEILALANRIVVMYEGTIVGEVQRNAFSGDRAALTEQIGLLMAGG